MLDRIASVILITFALTTMGTALTACGDGVCQASMCEAGCWTNGNSGSTMMHPGGDCIGCHQSVGEGPIYSVAGTVAYGLESEYDCEGVPDVTVRIVDREGQRHDLHTNAAGNFFTYEAFSTPYTASIILDGVEREMSAPQTNLNCASCHTDFGAQGALGRIVP